MKKPTVEGVSFIKLCLQRRRGEITTAEFAAHIAGLLTNDGALENIAIDVESLHASASTTEGVPPMKIDDDYHFDADMSLMRRHGLVVRSSVAAARRVIEQIADDELSGAIDVAQGAVHSGNAGKSWVILVIE